MPILCKISEGLTKDVCQFLIGGLKALYIANYEDVLSITDSDTDNILDDIDMGTSGSVFYKFDLTKNLSNFNQALQVGANKYVLQNVDFTVGRSDQTAYDVAESLALGTFIVIAEGRNGNKVILGQTNGMDASVLEINSGSVESDLAGIHVVLTGAELGFGKVFDGVIPV